MLPERGFAIDGAGKPVFATRAGRAFLHEPARITGQFVGLYLGQPGEIVANDRPQRWGKGGQVRREARNDPGGDVDCRLELLLAGHQGARYAWVGRRSVVERRESRLELGWAVGQLKPAGQQRRVTT